MAALEHWPERKAQRQALYEAYSKALDQPELASLMSLATQSSATSNLCVRIHSGIDDRCQGILAESGIETRRWYWPPLHRHPAFAHCPRDDGLNITDHLSDQLLGVPFHLSLAAQEIGRVRDALLRVLG